MTIDICFATYNSQKWLDACVKALAALSYNKHNISLYFADNASTDTTISKLTALKAEYSGVFGAFIILPMRNNSGFGAAGNAAARCGKSEYILFLNVDTEITPNAITALEAAINEADYKSVGFELRQYPYEHPKYYNPITLETAWCSGAAFALRRDIFALTGGFDESIFMYGEDVELSYRIRALGYKLIYVPSAVTWHYAYASAGEVKPQQLVGSITANLMLRCKYGTRRDVKAWDAVYAAAKPSLDALSADIKEQLAMRLAAIKANKKAYRQYYRCNVKGRGFTAQFIGADYEFARGGAFYECSEPTLRPTFSIIVRTYKRPEVLALTLASLSHQTYKDFEVIVVEDGAAPMAQGVAEHAKSKLSLKYIALNGQRGRCVAGNIGIKAAGGDFIIFLDDDDYFFADCLETFAGLHSKSPSACLLAGGAIEAACQYLDESGTCFKYMRKKNMGKASLCMFDFARDNCLPIQAIAFSRSLALKYGGLDEQLDALEDWDLWLRYLSHSEIAATDKAISIYKVPYDSKAFAKRHLSISKYRKIVYDKMAEYKVECSAQQIYALTLCNTADISTLDLIELQRTANEIRQSTMWRITAVIRFIPALPGGIINGCAAAFAWLSRKYRCFTNYIGSTANPEDMSPDMLVEYVAKAQSSVCMRVARWLQKLVCIFRK